MALKINLNIASQISQLNLLRNSRRLEKVYEQLSSGDKITKAGDDASGLAISQLLRSQVKGLGQAVRNTGDGQSVVDVAEAAMGNIEGIVQRIRELAVQAANDTYGADERVAIQSEINNLVSEIDRMASSVQFNRRPLLDGTFVNQRLQVGLGGGDFIALSIPDLRASVLGQVAQVTGLGGVSLAAVAGGGDLTVNGVAVPPTASDGVSFAFPAASAIAKAAAINRIAGQTGVQATAEPAVFTVAGGSIAGATLDGAANALFISGVNIGPVDVTAGDANGALRAAINAKSALTGVVATLSGAGELILTAQDGRTFEVTTTGSVADELGLALADGDLTGQIVTGRVSLRGSSQITVGGSDPGLIGFGPGQLITLPDASTALGTISVVTQADAELAIGAADQALRELSRARAGLGAISNRLENTKATVQTQSESLQLTDSRLRDTDFAEATARATQEQIIQQAATAILAQANLVPQMALRLLEQ